MSKNRKQKSQEYEKKYSEIPRDMEERLNWMIDKYNLSPQKMDEIIEKKRNMEFYLQYFDYKIIRCYNRSTFVCVCCYVKSINVALFTLI